MGGFYFDLFYACDWHDYFSAMALTPAVRMQKLKAPLVGAQGYQWFPLSKHVVGQKISLDAVPAYTASIPI